MMRITAYADRLLDDLDDLDWPETVKTMQRNWIGRSTGAHIDFPTDGRADPGVHHPPGHRVRRDVHGAGAGARAGRRAGRRRVAGRAPRRPWTGGHADAGARRSRRTGAFAAGKTDVERQADAKEKTGVFIGAFATNPVNGEQIPIFIADYVLAGYGTGAIMAVPGQDERDWEFAEVFDLPIVRTVQPPDGFEGKAYLGEGPAINTRRSWTAWASPRPRRRSSSGWRRTGTAPGATTYRLRDWLFSRQRYWGEPFPIVYDETGLPIALPESMLPVELPEVDDFSPHTFDPDDADSEPETPLSRAKRVGRGRAGPGRRAEARTAARPTRCRSGPARAGTSCATWTRPTTRRSSTRRTSGTGWARSATGDCGGVDLYVGGVEHAVLHLLYARFWHKVLYDLGHVVSFEPFRRLFNQGYIQAYAYTDARGVYVPAEEVVERERPVLLRRRRRSTASTARWASRLKNVVTPDDMCAAYGADTFRVYEMSMGPLDVSRPWETRAVVGSYRFLQRVWRLVVDEETGATRVVDAPADEETRRLLHRTIDGVRADMEEHAVQHGDRQADRADQPGHRGVAAGTPREVVEPLVLMISPFAPHLAEELWRRLGHDGTLAYEAFPVADPALLVGRVGDLPGAGQRQGARPDRGAGRRGRGRRARGGAGRGRGAPGRPRARARSSSCPAGWSASSSRDRARRGTAGAARHPRSMRRLLVGVASVWSIAGRVRGVRAPGPAPGRAGSRR